MIPAALHFLHPDASDADLVRLAQAGQRGAFVALMRRNNQLLYRTARSIIQDDVEAEDVVQDAYLLAHRALSGFRGDAKFSTWMVRIVCNEAIAHLRKRTRRAQVINLSHLAEKDIEMVAHACDDGEGRQPERIAERAQLRRLIETKIDALPEAFRTVFVLRAVEEMPAEEVAQCLEIPPATVRTRYFRAKSLLREALASELDFALAQAHTFDGARCDRIVESVLTRILAPARDLDRVVRL